MDWEVEDFADESVKVETMSIETEYLGNVPPVSQKKEMSISKVVTSTEC